MFYEVFIQLCLDISNIIIIQIFRGFGSEFRSLVLLPAILVLQYAGFIFKLLLAFFISTVKFDKSENILPVPRSASLYVTT